MPSYRSSSSQKAGLLNWAYTNVIYPIAEPGSYRGLRARMKRLEERESLSLEENAKLQWADLTKLLKHAYETSPFYQERFRSHGIQLNQIQCPNDLKAIPPLTRQDLKNHLQTIRSTAFAPDQLESAATGGTTDTPVPIVRSKESIQWKSAVQFRFDAWAGMKPGDKVFYLWGARQDYSENPSWKWRIYDQYLMRRVWAPTSLFNRDVLESYRQRINEFRPAVIYAYPTPLTLFCEYLRDTARDVHRPRTIICTAEPLFAEQRKTITETMGCDVFEQYGSRDFGMIAAECCKHVGLHLNPAAALLEYQAVPGADVTDLHELLVTDLLNYGMPLIRYKINDCALRSSAECKCGVGYPLMQQVIGRTMDNFLLANGDVVPGISFQNRIIKTCPGLAKTQVIQEELDQFRIRFVPGSTFSSADIDLLKTNLGRFLPSTVKVTFEQVDDIPRERSGKTRFCISKVRR